MLQWQLCFSCDYTNTSGDPHEHTVFKKTFINAFQKLDTPKNVNCYKNSSYNNCVTLYLIVWLSLGIKDTCYKLGSDYGFG